MNTRTRRDFLRTTMGGAAAATLASPLGYIGGAAAADPVQGVTWGGMWLDLIKEITDAQSIAMNWNTFPAGGSNSIVALTRASWPRPAYDISANWDPVWNLMYREGWLEAVTEAGRTQPCRRAEVDSHLQQRGRRHFRDTLQYGRNLLGLSHRPRGH